MHRSACFSVLVTALWHSGFRNSYRVRTNLSGVVPQSSLVKFESIIKKCTENASEFREKGSLPVRGQEEIQLLAGLGQNPCPGQVDDAEVVRFDPVEAGALDDQDLLLLEEIQCKLDVVRNVEFLRIDLRENIERRLRLLGRDAWNAVQRLIDKLPLVVNASAGLNIALAALVSAERGLHDGLRRHIGAEPHVGKHIQAVNIVPL